ncbi:MAG TPA: DEAD/DEAH box helicase [Patescibacteria group bacterium]|nr:DEAD/DEAH box helicase [Patescibacteria group bacterium]
MTHLTATSGSFSDLPIAPTLLSILESLHYDKPTPIQYQCITPANEGKDVVGIAQTGTGKTLAFAIPLIQRLSETKGQGLILLPTRELALQVNEVLQKVGRSIGLKTAVIIGGASSYEQIQSLRREPHIIVSTPGRLIDHLQQKNFNLNKVSVIVLDEADRMLDIGFMPAIKQILAWAPKNHQTMMFSATMPEAIAEIASRFMKLPIRIEVAPSGTAAENVKQEIFIISKDAKIQLLDKLLEENNGTVLVFSRTKFGAKKITANIRAMGHTAADIHSNKSLSQRRAALEGFKSGKFRVLVATDIASRGIDVKNISLVVNYDLPDNSEDYVHRIGRTGRANESGKAVSFVTPEERSDIRQIERLIKKTIPVIALPVLPPRRAKVEVSRGESRPVGRRNFARMKKELHHPRRYSRQG